MKHLKRISELYKSTYLKASDKLLYKSHPTRSKNIKYWAEEKGQSEFSKVNIDRIYPHAFIFSNHKDIKDKSWIGDRLLGKFYITGADKVTGQYTSDADAIQVRMMNDWGQTIKIDFIYKTVTPI